VDEKSCGGSGRSMLEVSWSASFMLDNILSEVKAMDLQSRKEMGDELLKRVKIFSYIPKPAQEQYKLALIKEFEKYREWGV
jgi:hypothetical protein